MRYKNWTLKWWILRPRFYFFFFFFSLQMLHSLSTFYFCGYVLYMRMMSNRWTFCDWFWFPIALHVIWHSNKKRQSRWALIKNKRHVLLHKREACLFLVLFLSFKWSVCWMVAALLTIEMWTYTHTHKHGDEFIWKFAIRFIVRMHVWRHVQCDILSLNEAAWFIHCLRCVQNYQWHNTNVYYDISLKWWKCAQWKQMWSTR